MCHFLFSDPIKEEMEAACVNMCMLENVKNTRTHTHTHACTHVGISVCSKDRDGEIQSPPTDGYHASGKEQVWTANWQLLPKQRWIEGTRTQSTSSVYIEWMCGKTNEGGSKFCLLHTDHLLNTNYLNQSVATETIHYPLKKTCFSLMETQP